MEVNKVMNKNTMRWTDEEVQEIVREGRLKWLALSRDEVTDWCCGKGTYGFVEQVLDELGIHLTDDAEQFEQVHDTIVYGPDVTHEYVLHLNLRTTKALSDTDVQMMVAKMIESLNNGDTIDIEYAHHEEL
jgi:hypothetical protein